MGRAVVLAAGLAGAAALGGLFLAGLAAKERDDRFCISCHLHEAKFTRFRAEPASDLAGLHHARKGLRCIDCHGGADPRMRVRVWTVAGFDTLRFLAGTYDEPHRMRLPLRPAECRQCHTPVRKERRELSESHDESTGGSGGDSYHAIRAHDAVDVSCVECHTAHTTDSEAARLFFSSPQVQPICARCHADASSNAASRVAESRAGGPLAPQPTRRERRSGYAGAVRPVRSACAKRRYRKAGAATPCGRAKPGRPHPVLD